MEGFELAIMQLEAGENVAVITGMVDEVPYDKGLEIEAQRASQSREQGRGGGSCDR